MMGRMMAGIHGLVESTVIAIGRRILSCSKALIRTPSVRNSLTCVKLEPKVKKESVSEFYFHHPQTSTDLFEAFLSRPPSFLHYR